MNSVFAIMATRIISDTAGARACITSPLLMTIALFIGVILGVNIFIFRKRFYRLFKNKYFWVIITVIIALAIAQSAIAATPVNDGLSYESNLKILPTDYSFRCPTIWEEIVQSWPSYLLIITIMGAVTLGLLQLIYSIARLFTNKPSSNISPEGYSYPEEPQVLSAQEIHNNDVENKTTQ